MAERWAIYRIHYGVDFLEESIRAIYNHVDRIVICVSLKPWTTRSHVDYLGRSMELINPENVLKFLDLEFFNDRKIRWLIKEFNTPKNQFGEICRVLFEDIYRYDERPDQVLMLEPDMILTPSLLDAAFKVAERGISGVTMLNQVEIWRRNFNEYGETVYYRVPRRDRYGPAIWNINDNIPTTNFGTGMTNSNMRVCVLTDETLCHNMGFCFNPRTMLYKHLTAMAFSSEIGDSLPSETWYRDKWLNWTPETTDLEIAAKYTNLIPKAEIYTMPDEIAELIEGHR